MRRPRDDSPPFDEVLPASSYKQLEAAASSEQLGADGALIAAASSEKLQPAAVGNREQLRAACSYLAVQIRIATSTRKIANARLS
jgi:hypothetical protein